MTRQDWTLLVLAAAGGERLTPVQLQKCLFLIGKKLNPSGEFYDFRPYHYGPFDANVYRDAEVLEHQGLAFVRSGRFKTFAATPAGVTAAAALSVTDKAREYVHGLVKWARSQTFQQIVLAVYEQYPDMRASSIFRG